MNGKDKMHLKTLFKRTLECKVMGILILTSMFKLTFAYGVESELVTIDLLPTRQIAICTGEVCESHALIEYLPGPRQCADHDKQYILIVPDGSYRVRAEPDLFRFGDGDWRQASAQCTGACYGPTATGAETGNVGGRE